MRNKQQEIAGAVETVRDIADGRLTAEQVTRLHLNRIAELEAGVEAWVAIDEAGAIAAAQALDSGPLSGPLHGVPLGVKDIFAVKDLPWRCGSPIWRDRVAGFDAGSVALARRAGAVVLGKTETTEFACYKPSRTRNPAAPGKTPGGSSSGSAAAVACGMVPLALGTQTSGSIIRPASFCGVVGYKPSLDLVEAGGVTPLARSLDTVGVFARSVPDAALGVEAMTGLTLQPDPATVPGTLSLYRSPFWNQAEPELQSAWDDLENQLARQSGVRDQVFAPKIEEALKDAASLHARMMALEASEALAFEHDLAPELLSPGLLEQLEEGRAATAEQRAGDRLAMRTLRRMFEAEVPADAVWITPSATGSAPDFDSGTGNPIFNRLWSLLGVPCCSVPILRSPEEGHPIGVQVVGAMGNDRGVLTVANWLLQHFG